MNNLLISFLQIIMLVIALSIDAFVASFAYGTDKIKIPITSLLIIAFICSATLAVSIFAGGLLTPFISAKTAKYFCFAILFILGIVKLFDSALKAFLKKYQNKKKQLTFHLFDIKFILKIYIDSSAADADCSRKLSAKEAASLAIALSLDGLGVGFGAGLVDINIFVALFLSLLFTIIAIVLGSSVGKKLMSVLKYDISWLSGGLLIALAFLKL